MKAVPVALVVAFPALIHAGILLERPVLAFAALMSLAAAVLFKPLSARRAWAWGALLAAAGVLWGLAAAGAGRYAIYLPSLAIPVALGLLFGRTLRPGVEPMISRFARLARGGTLAPDLALYTRRLTQLWTAVFVLMFLSALVLLLLDRIRWWSLLTNVLNYAALALLFAAEYAYRRWRFPHHEHPGFVAHIRGLFRYRPSAT